MVCWHIWNSWRNIVVTSPLNLVWWSRNIAPALLIACKTLVSPGLANLNSNYASNSINKQP